MRLEAVLALAALAAALGGCARQADTAAEERVIRELDRKWVQAVAAKDTMAIGNFYAEDGEFLPHGGPRVTGRAAVRSAWAQFLKAPNLSLTFEPAKVVVSSAGDLAYETGTYTLSMDGPKGQRVEDTGKFVVAWKRVGNEWKAALDIFNSDRNSM
jgi:uncharacterized protein (TIGR02246 family)